MKKEYEALYLAKDNEAEALSRLVEIVKVLRKECPWDREQTHETLTKCMLEEAYEAVDAILEQDTANLREELGDVLLQVVFHSNLSENEGDFTLADVINEECDKMIRRHPHIFLEENAKTIDKALEKWENMKSQEHEEHRYTDRLTRVPKALPALIRSSKVQSKAAKIGFDWQDASGPFDKIQEEFEELSEAYRDEDEAQIAEEFGDLLFSMVNASRFLRVNPEEALNQATAKFVKRFDCMEKIAEAGGRDLGEMSLEEMDRLWLEAKKK
ncbi:nucleoside triphosphate pyrophosphohydrolase [Anaerovoracaceae bacterium 42-11]